MHIPSLSAALLLLVAALPGCAPPRLLDAVTPAGEYQLHTDLSYGPFARQRLDVYQPLKPSPRAAAVIFFYGGGWRSGEKANYRFIARH